MTGVRVVTLGETMALVRADETGSLRHVRDMSLGIGGAESNVAVGLSRLGVDASCESEAVRSPAPDRGWRESTDVYIDPNDSAIMLLGEHRIHAVTPGCAERNTSTGMPLREPKFSMSASTQRRTACTVV